MTDAKKVVLAHGGAGSPAEYFDGTQHACEVGLRSLDSGLTVMQAVVETVVALEDDPRFNAGVGSKRRADGSVQMDAACMDSGQRFGAVAAVSGFKNPVQIALAVSKTKHRLMAGPGAETLARQCDLAPLDLDTVVDKGTKSSDTVGAVMYDGEHFAAALSTGGTGGSLPGRVGDVPIIGCGLYAGPYGAVAATGDGEAITMQLTAFRAYQMLEEGMGPHFVLEEVFEWFKEDEDIGLLLVNRKDHAAGSNRSMAWSEIS